ncbi:MAG: phage tail tape measure protein [Thermoguttaceae bacterium]|nr:phage tail tape measure protein [Thermoguttaceae bacterium]
MASANAIRAARAFVELFADTTKLQQGLRQAENMLKEFSTRATTLGRTVTAAGGIMIAPIAASIKTFYQFDDNMREVQAVTQATGKEFDALSEKAKKLGRETSFTAIQVSQAMATLGRAGFKSSQIDASISSILDLARATRTDLNEAARIASLSMRGFTLDASEMTRVSDVLSVVSNGAALNLVDFGESMKYVAPVAQQAGMSIEDAAGAIGVLSNFGIKGTMAGTALKNILTRMANTEVAAKFKQIGVETKDAQGNLRALIDVLYDVAKATQYMGSGDRMEIFKGLADLRALPSFAVMANNPEKIVDMIDELRVSMGKAAEMSALMDAGLGGAFRMFISAVESASISLAEAVTGPLQNYMESIKSAVNDFNAWVKANGKAIRVYAKTALVLIGLGGAMYGIGKAAQILSSTFAMIRGTVKGLSGAFGILTNSLLDFSGTTKLLEAHQKAVDGERNAQKRLGQVQAQLNRAVVSRQHWQGVLSQSTAGTKAYTNAANNLTEATNRELVLKQELTRAQLQYNAAQAAAAKTSKTVGGGTKGGIAWTALKGTYHRLGGNITDQTNWFAGKRVIRDVISGLKTVQNAAVEVGKVVAAVLQAPFSAMKVIIQSTTQFFTNAWGRSLNAIRSGFVGLRRAFSGQSIVNAVNTAFGAIRAVKLRGMIASIKGIGLAAKASAVGVGVLKIGLNSLVSLAGGIAGIVSSLLIMKSIGSVMSAFNVNYSENVDNAAEAFGARLESRSEELNRLMRQVKMFQEAQKNNPLSDDAFERAKFAIDTLNKSVKGLGLTYNELTKTISVAGDAQDKLNQSLKDQKEFNLVKQIDAIDTQLRKLRDDRQQMNWVMAGMSGEKGAMTLGQGIGLLLTPWSENGKRALRKAFSSDE